MQDYRTTHIEHFGVPTNGTVVLSVVFFIFVLLALGYGVFHMISIPRPTPIQEQTFFEVQKHEFPPDKLLFEKYPVDPNYVQEALSQ